MQSYIEANVECFSFFEKDEIDANAKCAYMKAILSLGLKCIIMMIFDCWHDCSMTKQHLFGFICAECVRASSL